MEPILKWILPVVILAIGLMLQIDPLFRQYIPLARTGALVVAIGIVLEGKYVLRIIGDKVYTNAEVMEVGSAPPPKNVFERLERINNHAGFYWIVLGTLVWGFGDLL